MCGEDEDGDGRDAAGHSVIFFLNKIFLLSDEISYVTEYHIQEQCDLEPQKICTTATKMIPQLKRSKECVDVPKEVCAMSRVNPTLKTVPFIQNWCFKPEEVDLQNILKLG